MRGRAGGVFTKSNAKRVQWLSDIQNLPGMRASLAPCALRLFGHYTLQGNVNARSLILSASCRGHAGSIFTIICIDIAGSTSW